MNRRDAIKNIILTVTAPAVILQGLMKVKAVRPATFNDVMMVSSFTHEEIKELSILRSQTLLDMTNLMGITPNFIAHYKYHSPEYFVKMYGPRT